MLLFFNTHCMLIGEVLRLPYRQYTYHTPWCSCVELLLGLDGQVLMSVRVVHGQVSDEVTFVCEFSVTHVTLVTLHFGDRGHVARVVVQVLVTSQ